MNFMTMVYEGIAATVIIVMLSLLIGYAVIIITHKSDTVGEQACESIMEHQLHLPPGTIDLSPED